MLVSNFKVFETTLVQEFKPVITFKKKIIQTLYNQCRTKLGSLTSRNNKSKSILNLHLSGMVYVVGVT